MKFKLTFGSAGAVSFEIDEAALERHPDTMLAVMSRPRWNTGGDAVQVLAAPDTVVESWSDGMAEFVVGSYALADGEAPRLPSGVELKDAVAVADWLSIPFDVDNVVYPDGIDDGNLARVLRAKAYVKRRAAVGKGIAHMVDQMQKSPSTKYAFIFLKNASDSINYINSGVATPFLAVGSMGYMASSVEQFGNRAANFEWAEDKGLREECKRTLEGYGLAATWLQQYVELSGPRGMDYAPGDLSSVHGKRWSLTVTVADAEPASKRRKYD